MAHTTKLNITLRLEDDETPGEALSRLPGYSVSSFERTANGEWEGDFVVSCAVAPEFAEGDFIEDFVPYFPVLLELQQDYKARFAFEIAVGKPAANEFKLSATSVALLAALGVTITVRTNLIEQATASTPGERYCSDGDRSTRLW